MPLLDKIRSRGYWEVLIRPSTFTNDKVPSITSLYPILRKCYVSLRGLDFPHLDERQQPQIDIDWIAQEFEWEHILSSWRFYQSGLFIYLSGISVDWRDQSTWWPADKMWKPGTLLGVGDVLFRFTEIYEFAARLSLTEAGDDLMHIDIKVANIKGRTLYIDETSGWFSNTYTASLNEFPISIELLRSDLVANAKDYAVKNASELFKRFGWDTTTDDLRSRQMDLLRR